MSKLAAQAPSDPVVFRSNRLNMTLQVRAGASETNDPAAPLHPDVKEAKFQDGIFSTKDPEIIAFLDARGDVWRMDDPEAELKNKYGPDEYERLRRIFESASVPSTTPDEESGEE